MSITVLTHGAGAAAAKGKRSPQSQYLSKVQAEARAIRQRLKAGQISHADADEQLRKLARPRRNIISRLIDL